MITVAIANENRVHIQLRDVPRTALPSDVQRTVFHKKLVGVSDGMLTSDSRPYLNLKDYVIVAIDYHRFAPTGRAYLTLTASDLLNANLRKLHDATISSMPVQSVSAPQPGSVPRRARGPQGRAEAAERGVLSGNGPRGGLSAGGMSVVLWGLPGRLTAESLRAFLRDFTLAGTEGGKKEFMKIPL